MRQCYSCPLGCEVCTYDFAGYWSIVGAYWENKFSDTRTALAGQAAADDVPTFTASAVT